MFGDIESARRRNDLLLEKAGSYAPWSAYGNSKLANILFTRELAKRLKNSDKYSNVGTFTLHPG